MAIATWELNSPDHRRHAAACAADIALRLPTARRAPRVAPGPRAATRPGVPAQVRRRVTVLALLAILLGTLAVTVAGSGTASRAAVPSARTAPAPAVPAAEPAWELSVVIGAGETVWELAAPHAPAGTDLQLYVSEVLAHNGLDARAIPPGTVIRLPQ